MKKELKKVGDELEEQEDQRYAEQAYQDQINYYEQTRGVKITNYVFKTK